MEKLAARRPSLQSDAGAAGRCASVALPYCGRGTEGDYGGIRASSPDFVGATHVVRVSDCPGNQDRPCALRPANAADARADKRMPRSSTAVEPGGAVEIVSGMLYIAYSP